MEQNSAPSLVQMRSNLEDFSSRIPKTHLVFPPIDQLLSRASLVDTLQKWMAQLNDLECLMEELTGYETLIGKMSDQLQYKKKLLQSNSEMSSTQQFERSFLKRHWDLYRAIQEWGEVRKIAHSLRGILKMRHRAYERNCVGIRSIGSMIRDGQGIREVTDFLMRERGKLEGVMSPEALAEKMLSSKEDKKSSTEKQVSGVKTEVIGKI